VALAPDSVRSEIFSRIWIGYGSGKNNSGSGHLWIRNEFEVNLSKKLTKFDEFSTKMLKFKI
jgi:hypothetical protein